MISAMPSGRPRTPPRQRASLANTRSRETRQELIRVALKLWGEGDFEEAYESTTGADIARAAGVSKGTFYFHFSSKEDILLEMSSTTVQAMIDQVDVGTRRAIPLMSLSEKVMASMAQRVTRAPRAAALRVGTLGFASRVGEAPTTGTRLGVAFESLVRYGIDRNELGPEVDVDEAVAMLTAVTMEAIVRWGAGNRSAIWLRQTLRDRVDVVLIGIGYTPVS